MQKRHAVLTRADWTARPIMRVLPPSALPNMRCVCCSTSKADEAGRRALTQHASLKLRRICTEKGHHLRTYRWGHNEAPLRCRPDAVGAPPRVVAALLGAHLARLTAGLPAHGTRPLRRAGRLRGLHIVSQSRRTSSTLRLCYDSFVFTGTTLFSSPVTKRRWK